MSWSYLWLAWLLAFCVIEGIAIFDSQRGNTLSENVWAWFSIKGKGRAWRFRRFVLLSFMAWLTVHFVSGGFL